MSLRPYQQPLRFLRTVCILSISVGSWSPDDHWWRDEPMRVRHCGWRGRWGCGSSGESAGAIGKLGTWCNGMHSSCHCAHCGHWSPGCRFRSSCRLVPGVAVWSRWHHFRGRSQEISGSCSWQSIRRKRSLFVGLSLQLFICLAYVSFEPLTALGILLIFALTKDFADFF